MLRRIFATLALSLLVAACRGRGAIDPKAPIIIISIDTLRSDHLPAYGYGKVETPNIDAFRSDAILYERAYAECPLTLVSHASLFTGSLPAEHGIRDNLGYKLDPKAKTLAELLKANGYATGGAVSAVVLRGDTGIRRGFDFWDDDIDVDVTAISIARSQRSGDATRESAERWIGAHKTQPFFFFLHLYEPHTPYDPPEPFRTKYGTTYDGEIATADAIVGKFLDHLRNEGLYDRATIVLLSDHGEGLRDHGEDEHGLLLYREAIQVPLMLKLPKSARRGASVSTPVQLIDVFPTIASAFPGSLKAEGQSLLDAADGKVKDDRTLYAETYYPRLHFGWNDLHSIVSGTNHYIHAHKPELFDLAADPGEKTNVLAEKRRVYTALRQSIEPYIHAAAAPSPVDDEQKQQLAALGYVGSTAVTNPNELLPDPYENIGKVNEIGRAYRSFVKGDYADADRTTAALLHENPNMVDLWALRAKTLAKLNRNDEAIECAKEAFKRSPEITALAAMVATLSLDAGRLDEAEQHARLLVKETPYEAHQMMANIAIARKDFAKATEEANAAAKIHPDRANTKILLGRISMEQGHLEEALEKLNEAATQLAQRHGKPIPKLNFYRGDTLARMGRGEEAEQAFHAEIAAFPDDPSAYKNLILLYALEGRSDAATQLVFALEKAAPTPPSYIAISETLKTIGDVNGARFWAARGLQKFPADTKLQALRRG
jgi:arylsulfatase A-like enzyme/Flp pilus assembly protein TadD